MSYGRSFPQGNRQSRHLGQQVGGRVFGRTASTVATLQHHRIKRMAFLATKPPGIWFACRSHANPAPSRGYALTAAPSLYLLRSYDRI